ncbi:MAG: hypothetical protein HKP57_01395 [Halobacteria archaeon]|nr:hypothetical protein [Halobacteria archaeon]
MKRNYLVCAIFILAMGCSEKDSNVNVGQDQDSVFESQVRTIDNAEEIEQTLDDAAAKQRQAIDEQGK